MTPQVVGDQAGAPPAQLDPRIVVRAISRHWWQILSLWLVVSAPIAFLLYMFVKPTYVATSVIRVEPTLPDMFTPLSRDTGEIKSTTYLKTQVNIITTDKVLDPAVADVQVSNLPTIRKSEDPKADLRKNLVVEIVPDTNLIRVALELPDPEEAVTIVRQVVQQYMTYNVDYSRGANKDLAESLEEQLKKLGTDIKALRDKHKELLTRGNVAVFKVDDVMSTKADGDGTGSQSTLKKVTPSQVEKIIDEIVHTEHELQVTQSKLEVKLSVPENVEPSKELDEKELQTRIFEEFRNDPEIQGLMSDINEKQAHLKHTQDIVRQSNDPARIHAQREVDQLQDEYTAIWRQKYPAIRKRLTGADPISGSAEQSTESVAYLKLKVLELSKLLEKETAQLKTLEVDQKAANGDTIEATYIEQKIKSLMGLEEQVSQNLERINFEKKQDRVRIVLIDSASVPKAPSNNKRLKYMAAAPVAVLFMMLGLFLLLEIKAERVGDPDALSTRVRSEVFALPQLPTARSLRKLGATAADDQIEQFIQRLDHLRFAVCGTPADLGKGRCVLITSAIGGEGKTTLAAQLAARCGNAGMSTLLIDSDFRRGSLCPLLDVPEGPGLSDILKDEATLDEVTIPVQGGTFYLLPAGTPIQDTSRLLQGPKFGQLMGQLRELYDLIIVDSPPVLPVPDALILGRWSDGAVIAARYDISRFPQVERARRQLDNAGIAVLGTVINGMRNSDSYYGRYTYSRRRSNQADTSTTI